MAHFSLQELDANICALVANICFHLHKSKAMSKYLFRHQLF